MFSLRLNSFVLVVACVGIVAFTCTASADFWSDASGQYKIEADYVGVEGKNIVLRKPDGSTVKVPIERLSSESRDRAKRLYDAAKSNASKPAAMPRPAAASDAGAVVASAAANQSLGFEPPVAPEVPPLPAFPTDASLQETVDFIREQVLTGHPEVFWYAFPDEMREVLDSPDYRSKLASLESPSNDAVVAMLTKAVQVLITKKDFVLGSQMLAQLPPPVQPMVQQIYDPVVGVIYEFTQLTRAQDQLKTMTVTEFVDQRGSSLGGHLRVLLEQLPPGTVEQFTSQITVVDEDATHGTITMTKPGGDLEQLQLTKVDGRWLPNELATKWAEAAGNFKGIMDAEFEKLQAREAENAEATKQANAMMATAVTMATGMLDPLLQASTQQEFDVALQQISAMAAMFAGNQGPQ